MFIRSYTTLVTLKAASITFLLCLEGAAMSGCSEDVHSGQFDPTEVVSITVYDRDGFKEVPNDLSHLRFSIIDGDTTKDIMKEMVHERSKPIWKGSLFGIAHTDDKDFPLAISLYGGFFSVKNESGHYRPGDEAVARLSVVLDQIVQDEFVPARRVPNKSSDEAK